MLTRRVVSIVAATVVVCASFLAGSCQAFQSPITSTSSPSTTRTTTLTTRVWTQSWSTRNNNLHHSKDQQQQPSRQCRSHRQTTPPLFADPGRSSSNNETPVSTDVWTRSRLLLLSSKPRAPPTTALSTMARRKMQLKTLLRVGIPSVLIGVIACWTFPAMSMGIAYLVNESGALTVLSQDSSQFVQNYLTVASLLFSILVGQTCTCIYCPLSVY